MSVSSQALATTPMRWQTRVRIAAAAVAAIVVVDAISVGAPNLAILAVPFAVIAIGLRKGHLVSLLLVLLWAALYVVLALNYAVAHRFDAPAGDLLFAYVGGSAAAVMLVTTAAHLPRSRR